MANPYMAGAGALMLLIAQACLWVSLIVYQLPGAQEGLANSIKADLPPKVVPVLVSYYPDLNAFTYESAVEYCKYKEYSEMNLSAEGITDEYVCQIVEGGLVTNTEELRVFLARKVVEQKVDDVSGIYGPQISYYSSFVIYIVIAGGLFAVMGFAFLFFGTKDVPECAFLYSLFSGLFASLNLLLMGIGFMAAPAIVLGKAEEIAGNTGLGRDVLSLMSGSIKGTIEGVFIIPIILFGVLSLVFAVGAFISYMMNMAPEKEESRSKHRRRREKERLENEKTEGNSENK
jgi:hypothetical protein